MGAASLSCMDDVGCEFVIHSLYYVEVCSLQSYSLGLSSWMHVEFCHLWWWMVMHCLSVIYYICWLTSMEPSLHLWGKSQLDRSRGKLCLICAFTWFVIILLRMFPSVLMSYVALSSPHLGVEEMPIDEDWKSRYALNNLKVMVVVLWKYGRILLWICLELGSVYTEGFLLHFGLFNYNGSV